MSDYKPRRYANSHTEVELAEVLRGQLPEAVIKVPTEDWIAVAFRRDPDWKGKTAAKMCILWKRSKKNYDDLFYLTLFYDYNDFQSFWSGIDTETHKIIDIKDMKDRVPPLHKASKKYRTGGNRITAKKGDPTEWDHAYAHMVFNDRGWCTFDEYTNAINAAQGDRAISELSQSGTYQVLPPLDNDFEYGFNIRITPKGKK